MIFSKKVKFNRRSGSWKDMENEPEKIVTEEYDEILGGYFCEGIIFKSNA
jgi:hypothetical protein